MKKIGLLLMCFATLAMTSCGMLQSAASSDPVAMTAGQTCGTAVRGLYSAYSDTKTIDMTNATNLSNALALASAYTAINQNKDNAAYRKAFTAGLVASSAGLLTKGTANTFVDQLLGATGLSGLNSSNIAQKANTVSTIVNLLQTLKQ